MEIFEIKASNGWKYNVRASDEAEARSIFKCNHPDWEVVTILNEDQAIMASLDKGFE